MYRPYTFKIHSEGYLMNMTKADLVERIGILESNYDVLLYEYEKAVEYNENHFYIGVQEILEELVKSKNKALGQFHMTYDRSYLKFADSMQDALDIIRNYMREKKYDDSGINGTLGEDSK